MQALNCHPLEISHGTFLPITDLWVTSLNNKYEERTLLQKWGNRSLVPYCFRLCLTQQRWIFIRLLACVVPGLCLALDEVDLSSCHIVFVVRSDHFHRKSRTQASSTSDIFIKFLIVQWICIWYTKNLLSKLLDLIVKNTKNLCKRLIPLYIFNVQNCDKPTYTCMNIFLNFLYYLKTSEQWMSLLIN